MTPIQKCKLLRRGVPISCMGSLLSYKNGQFVLYPERSSAYVIKWQDAGRYIRNQWWG